MDIRAHIYEILWIIGYFERRATANMWSFDALQLNDFKMYVFLVNLNSWIVQLFSSGLPSSSMQNVDAYEKISR